MGCVRRADLPPFGGFGSFAAFPTRAGLLFFPMAMRRAYGTRAMAL
jgi:hypothetical protein